MPAETVIRILPDDVANKIAAGEVVDRPASVLKELMENALDAGATRVDVEVVEGGRKAIVVSDNGRGMVRDDAVLSIERHATSKIRDVHDIERIATLGFRGEALAAIASVSRFSMITRAAGAESGVEILVSGGRVQEVKEAGCPVGTSVRVRHLFFNVPARRKFLRAEQTELAHFRQTFLVYALSHAEVGMSITVDGRVLYRLPPGARLEDRIRDLFGSETAAGLRPVQASLENVTIQGYAGLPHLSRTDRSGQFLFINRRPAAAALLSYALDEGYHSLIPKGRYPTVFLFISIDPGLVDVNVHPTKKEVRFRQPILVRDTLIESIREALAQAAPAAAGPAPDGAPPAEPPAMPQPTLRIEDLPVMRPFAYPRMALAPAGPAGDPAAADAKPAEPAATPAVPASPWAWCRVLGQVGGLYVVMETEEGMVLMDPHAAHERVLYEKFMKRVLDRESRSQGLLVPETVDLPPGDAQCVRRNLDLLKEMGFGISEFGGDSFIIDGLPVTLGNLAAGVVLREVAASLERGGSRGGAERWAQEAVAQAACKAAVKARDKLSVGEIEQLVVDLARSEMPYTCPHGRPTVIFMGYSELDRKFGRA
jgi:DNA mismatch repair protein MutL